jgi:hypothetical protein
MDSFTTIFEISGDVNGIRTESLVRIAIGVGALASGAIGLSRWLANKERSRKDRIGPIFLTAWGLLWLAFHVPVFISIESTKSALLARYHRNQFDVVEGVVEVKHEQPASGHAKGDVVVVGGREFEVNFFTVSPSYTTTISHGGALKPGVYARLSYVDGNLLKVEIRNPPNKAPEPTTMAVPSPAKQERRRP